MTDQTVQRVNSANGRSTRRQDKENLDRRVRELGPWFHNMELLGVQTAPDHFLGDFPNLKWQPIAKCIPQNLEGATVLDIGCNAGFYSLQMKKRGAARVVGIDIDDRYLKQAGLAAEVLGLDVEFRKCSVYEIDTIPEKFDYVVFMGVFYHLRYPLYALDKVVKKVGDHLLFQTMIRGSHRARQWAPDYPFTEEEIFQHEDFPRMYFIERKFASDPTNWWIPNRSAVEAILRSAGLVVTAHPEAETWLCSPNQTTQSEIYVQDREFAGLPLLSEVTSSQGRGND